MPLPLPLASDPAHRPAPPSLLAVWLADLTYTQQTIAADVIPNAVGGIATYTEKHANLTNPVRIFKYPEKLRDALEAEMPDIIGFSNYVWNSELALAFARAIKRRAPRCVIVFGGPNYPTTAGEQAAWLRAHPDVDLYLVKEGEASFARLVAALTASGNDVDAVKRLRLPSIHGIVDGEAVLTHALERLTDLTDIPSPYTSGRLDEFFDGRLLPIVQTNRGCPFYCTFCVEGDDYYNKIRKNARAKIDAELHYIGRKMQELRQSGGRNDLFIADSNFGMYLEDLDTARTLSETRHHYGWPEYINVATGKNQKERVLEASRIIDGALRLSGSVQSLDPQVLENIKRKNIDARGLFELGLQAEAVGANTYSEIILALPGDSLPAHLSTIQTVMDAGFTNIYLFQLMLLPGTELATPETKAQYGMVSRFRVLPRCYGHYEVLGERLLAAEIEEICVANSTLSFEDYLAARRFHLLVTIYHNDGIFAALLKLLRSLDVPAYGWMEEMAKAPMPPGLAGLFDHFERATREELWDSREALEAFIREPGIVEKFIAGELGNNLLFVHKTMAITSHLDDLAEFARTTIQRVLERRGHAVAETLEFVDDALRYHCARAARLFEGHAVVPTETLRFDIDRFLGAAREADFREARLPGPTRFRFILDATQRSLIERYLGIYGSSTVSIGRILSKVHVKKLFRHAVEANTSETDVAATASDVALHLSGLQE
jgi:tRNA A37 methylthiotransferase MiaB